MTARANIYIDRAADFNVEISIFDEDEDPLLITTCDFYADIRKIYSSTSIGSFGIQKNTTTINLYLSANNTVDFEPGKYQYDVLMVNAGGETFKILEGLAFVTSTITRIE